MQITVKLDTCCNLIDEHTVMFMYRRSICLYEHINEYMITREKAHYVLLVGIVRTGFVS